jgi:DNA topoisomerase III
VTIAVVAEKPSVGRDLARVLGATKRGDGCLSGNGYVVTWAIGHLVALAEPHEMNPAWKQWRPDYLPILPEKWPLSVLPNTRGQYDTVARILGDRRVTEIVCATDAGREGELIFRYVLEKSGIQKPVKRLWLSSLTDEAITDAFGRLRDLAHYDGLADAARGRSRADWLVGMNLSRAYTLSHSGGTFGDMVSVGRVQTPTLAMVVTREETIRAFVPEPYVELVATFGVPKPAGETEAAVTYQGRWERPEGKLAKGQKPTPLEERRRLAPGEEAEAVQKRAKHGQATVAEVLGEKERMPSPLLYDLTELQRHANRLFGFSAQKTLDLAQALYEEHKLISYPRTDSRHLSEDVARSLGPIVQAVRGPYEASFEVEPAGKTLGRRYVDDAKVTDHHAILPTTKRAGALPADLGKLYDLICRRLLQAFQPDHETATTVVFTEIESQAPADDETAGKEGKKLVDRFRTSGTLVLREGWKKLDRKLARPSAGEPEPLPPVLTKGLVVSVESVKAEKKMTKPPPRYTDATLLSAMETAGRALDDKELSAAMKDRGLGTPATRAATIETLLRRTYVARDGQSLVATDKGIGVIRSMHEEVKSPAMTGEWEAELARISRGEATLDDFLGRIGAHVATIVRKVLGERPRSTHMASSPSPFSSSSSTSSGVAARARPSVAARAPVVAGPAETARGKAPRAVPLDDDGPPADDPRFSDDFDAEPPPAYLFDDEPPPMQAFEEPPRRRPEVPASLVRTPAAAPAPRPRASTPPVRRPVEKGASFVSILNDRFGFAGFRPYQEAVCTAVRDGHDTLLVMPTGAGKSLCYQLPAIARGGTALVVSPLIALMEDQVEKLRQGGFSAERIHSGRGRDEARATCRAYLDGELDFLFVAPERLRVPGFLDMIGKRPLSLVAIDEAHCISRWGHDFRPEYRMLGQRLPQLLESGCPVVAVTATATRVVQDDIVDQLGLRDARRFIHGFRRQNLAIEVVSCPPKDRADAVVKLLADSTRRPAIIYAPTRKEADRIADTLGKRLAVAAYHAGLGTARREEVQTRFLTGKLDLVVATIAFGMGVDKADVRTVVHMALPGSVEGYYQEIGRAGRDGKPSRVVLLHSFVDRKTHEFFHERDYPDMDTMTAIYEALGPTPRLPVEVASRAKVTTESAEKGLDKLWIHGGAILHEEESFLRGDEAWKRSYPEQEAHKRREMMEMARLAEGNTCRMLAIVRYFGDQNDDGAPCGTCDICAPDDVVLHDFAPSAEADSAVVTKILKLLAAGDLTGGQLHRDHLASSGLSRNDIEHVIGGLVRAGMVTSTEDRFEKDGKTIAFQRLAITATGLAELGDAAVGITIRVHKRPGKAARGARGEKAPREKRERKTKRKSVGGEDESPLVEELRKFRREEAKRLGVPAYRVFTDKQLFAIAEDAPETEDALSACAGMYPSIVKKFGEGILRAIRSAG